VADAVTNKEYGALDRARMLAPVAMLPALAAMQLGIAPIREGVFGTSGKKTQTDDEQWNQFMLQAAGRSGLTGAWDPLITIYTGVRYRRSVTGTIGGPVVGGAAQLIDGLIALSPKSAGGTNSDKTNTSERNVARGIYEAGVVPSVMLGASLLPAPIGMPIAQAVTLGPVKDAFVDAAAGPKQTTGSGPRYGRPERPERPSRR
jgi:hypothetical protein